MLPANASPPHHRVPTFISRHLFSGPDPLRVPSLSWSRTRQIAIAANKRVLVLESCCKSKSGCISFDTSCINIPETSSESDDTPEQVSLMQQEILNRLATDEDVFLAKMDRLIPCHGLYQESAGDSCPYSCTIRSAVWSPVLRNSNSILSVLMCDSDIRLFQKRQHKWTRLGRHEAYVRSTLQEKRQDELLSQVKSYEQLKSHFYRTGITAMTWAAPDETDEFTFLITGSKAGSLFFWKVSVTESQEDSPGGGDPFRLELRHEWHPGLGHICRMVIFSHYLLIGTHSGQVIAVNLSSLLSSPAAAAAAANPAADEAVSLRRLFVWEEKDDLPAEHFLAYKLSSESSFLIVLAKGTFLVLIRIGVRGIGANEQLDRREVVVRGRHEMPVTAMCDALPEDGSPITCLISSADGLLTRVRLPDDPFAANSPTIRQEDVAVEGLLKSRSAIYGLTSSPFRVFTAALQTVIPYRDTFIMRQGSILIIFPNVTFQQTLHCLAQPIPDPDHTLEYVMAYRSFLDKGEPYDVEELVQQNFGKKSVPSLKVTRHMILSVRDFLLSNTSSSSGSGSGTVDKHQAHITLLTDALISIDRLLFQHHASHHISSSAGRGTSLSSDQQESLDLMRVWLQKIDSDAGTASPSSHSAGKQRNKKQKGNPSSSSGGGRSSSGSTPCPICCKALPLVDQENPVCPDGHVFSRCSSSLLLCDPAVCQMDHCSLCRRCFRLPAVWEMRYPCIFCY